MRTPDTRCLAVTLLAALALASVPSSGLAKSTGKPSHSKTAKPPQPPKPPKAAAPRTSKDKIQRSEAAIEGSGSGPSFSFHIDAAIQTIWKKADAVLDVADQSYRGVPR